MKAAPNSCVALVGLGSMGLGMASAMSKAGLDVTAFDLDAQARARFEAAGGRTAGSARDAAAGAGVLVLVVVNAAQVRSILFGETGASAALAPGAVVVSCASVSPADARELAAATEAAGLLYIDAPMSGGAVKAASGDLSFMASGRPEAFAKADAALQAMAGTVHRLGDEAGIGSSFKMVNQLLAGVHIAAACEAMALAARLGLDLGKVFEVIRVSAGNSWMFENRVPHILDGDYRPRSAVDIFTKDLGIVADMGRAEKLPTMLASTALQMFLMTAAAGMGRDDDASVARMLADLAGLRLPEAGTDEPG